MRVVTLIGVMFGVAVNLPEGFWLALIVLTPSFVPAIAISCFSRCRSLSLLFAGLGLLYGVTAWPLLGRSPFSFCCGFEDGDAVRVLMMFVLPGLFAAVAAGCYWHVERCWLRLGSTRRGSAPAGLGGNI